MATPAFLRYLPARLKPLGKPALWAPLAVFALLGAFLLEWRSNPDWFNRQPITNVAPESDFALEEAERFSNSDRLDVLVDGVRAPNDAEAVKSQISPGSPVLENEIEGDPDQPVTENGAASRNLADQENPFARYEEEYQFGGPRNTPANSSTLSPTQPPAQASSGRASTSASSSSNGSTFNFGNGLVNPAAPGNNSALSEALSRQLAAESNNQSQPNRSNAGSASRSTSSSATNGGQGEVAPTVQPASRTPTTYIPTTPDMSPPVGTTGYQLPSTSTLPTFNVAPQQATPNPFNRSQAPQQQFSTPPPAAAVPGLPNAAASPTPNVAAPTYTAPTFAQPDQGRPINPRR